MWPHWSVPMRNCKALTTRGKPCRHHASRGDYCHMHEATAKSPKAESPAAKMTQAAVLVDDIATRDEGRKLLTSIMRGEFKEQKTTSQGALYTIDTPPKVRIEAATLLGKIDSWWDGDAGEDAQRPRVGVYKPG